MNARVLVCVSNRHLGNRRGSAPDPEGGRGQELCCPWSAFFLPHTTPAKGEGGVGEKKCWWDAASSAFRFAVRYDSAEPDAVSADSIIVPV